MRSCCVASRVATVLAALLIVPLTGAGSVRAATPTATPPPINLDAYEARKHRVLLSNGERLAYLQMGDPKGRPVVLIHGYTDNARDWVPLIPFLSPSDRLIVVDLRGHGRSAKPECCYTRYDFAYDIKLLLDVLHVRQTDLIGHSMGSIVAQTFAESWPERTARVVLISPTGGPRAGDPPPKPGIDYVAEIRKLKEPVDPDSDFMVAWWSSPTPVDETFIRRQRQDAARIPLKVWIAVLQQGLSGTDLQSTLPELKAPTLLIWGSADPIFGPEARQSLIAALPNAPVKIFEGLGHNPFWEKPADVADTINHFLDRAN
jgi:pimeloyl-ACP methyl ester carboxylesterase